MKLVKCYVSSFGKLKDYTLELTKGLNIIKEDNGWGKSTIAMFIKSMFYGLKGSGKHSIEDNERKKYKPWGSIEKFGGYVDFDWNGTLFRIERFFGNKESEDEIKILDLKTGKSFPRTENLGERIFGIDEDGFFSTTYFSENDFEITDNTSLTAKYNSVLGVQSSRNFDEAVLKVENAAKKYKQARGSKGLIEDKNNEIKAVGEDIERASRSLETLKILKSETTEIEEKINSVKAQISSLMDRVAKSSHIKANEVKKKIYDDAKDEYEKLSATLKSSDVFFGGAVPDQDYLTTHESYYKSFVALQREISALNEEISKLEADINASKYSDNKKFLKVFFPVIGGILFALGIVLMCTVSLVFGIISSVLGVLMIVSTLLVKRKKRGITSELHNVSPKTLLDQKKKELIDLSQKEAFYTLKLKEFLNRFPGLGMDFLSVIFEVRRKLLERDNLIVQIEKAKSTLSEYSKDIEAFSKENVSENVDELENTLKEKQSYLSSLTDELAQKKLAASRHDEIVSSIHYLETKMDQLREEKAEFIDRYDVLTKTLHYLIISNENLKVKYREPLDNSFNKYISVLSSGKITGASIDVDFKVSIKETSGTKEQEYYSKGSQELFEVCKRFALIDVLFTQEKPFMVLDDPFVNFDESKIKHALALIKNLSETYQVIYFVCHESRRS